MITPGQFVAISAAAVAAGAVNAIAGGGTLITFPALTAIGVGVVAANVTNSVALCPGYLGATLAQWNDLKKRDPQLPPTAAVLSVSVGGGLVGAILLLISGEALFRALVPYLILLASALVAVQERVRRWLVSRHEKHESAALHGRLLTLSAMFVTSIYGGYFGAGASVINLAVLGLSSDAPLNRLNALKQAMALCINFTAAIVFAFSGHVVWSAALVMAITAMAGGAIGGRIAASISPGVLRWTVVIIGLVVGVLYLLHP